MAAIRNLRNLVLSGVDDAHVQKVCKFITNEKMVAGSRLFPFRFYTAYDVLGELEHLSTKRIDTKALTNRGKFAKKPIVVVKVEKMMKKQKTMNKKAIEVFRKALDKAVKIATVKNIPPIKGVTVIVCSAGSEMIKNLGNKSLSQCSLLAHAALLLGLMCQSCAEESQFWIYDCIQAKQVPLKDSDGDQDTNKSLLARVKKIHEQFQESVSGWIGPSTVSALMDPNPENLGPLVRFLTEKFWIDNFVWIHGKASDQEQTSLEDFISLYRQLINPDLFFVSVDVEGSGRRTEDDRLTRHPKDLRLSGFSEQIFLCLANSGSQVDQVENVDKRHKLPISLNIPEDRALPDPTSELKNFGSLHWRRVRVFISSTFMDMHGERDLLNRFVFPELARRCRKICVDILAIDLRWGLPHFGDQHDSQLAAVRQVRACIDEIDRCNFFIGFLGERYGWKPQLESISESSSFEAKSLAQKIGHVYKPGMSITELEMNYAALGSSPASKRDRVFFFLRDPTQLEKGVPLDFEHHFKTGSREDVARLEALKDKILRSGYEVSAFSC